MKTIKIDETQQSIETPKLYKNNREMFEDAKKNILKVLTSTQNRILDLGSYKQAIFAVSLAREYPETQITHFKHTKTLGKVDKKHKYDNLTYIFKPRKLKKFYFDIATSFFTLHDFSDEEPGYERIEELEILHKSLKPSGKIIIIDYNLSWINKENFNETEFIKEIFTEANERKVMREEDNCMQIHTAYGLEDYIKDCSKVGFEEKYSKNYLIQTSFGIKPKCFLYIGEKV